MPWLGIRETQQRGIESGGVRTSLPYALVTVAPPRTPRAFALAVLDLPLAFTHSAMSFAASCCLVAFHGCLVLPLLLLKREGMMQPVGTLMGIWSTREMRTSKPNSSTEMRNSQIVSTSSLRNCSKRGGRHHDWEFEQPFTKVGVDFLSFNRASIRWSWHPCSCRLAQVLMMQRCAVSSVFATMEVRGAR